MATAQPTTDHEEIQRWVEKRGGTPARVKTTGSRKDPGVLRIDFPGFSGEDTLEAIDWDEWFDAFDKNKLAILLDEGRGKFNKLVRRTATTTRRRTSTTKKKTASTKRAAAGTTKRAAASTKRASSRKSSNGDGDISANITTNHTKIQKWVEARGGFPAHVKRTGRRGDPGILRIDYPGFSGTKSLERISWDEWFDAFDKNKLAFLYQNKRNSRFSKLIER